uniref:DAN domain-containing protein n=1 Tax=Anopheles funestus TaxID=62324 RepID=A0A182RS48_ANOFN
MPNEQMLVVNLYHMLIDLELNYCIPFLCIALFLSLSLFHTHTHTHPLSIRPIRHFWSEDGGSHYTGDDCQVTPVIHVLQYPGCVPKPIPSFACIGRCASYIQVSGSKIWQMERSCMCCQESGEREASVSLFCPKAKNGEKKFRKVGSAGGIGVASFVRPVTLLRMLYASVR